MKQEEIDVEQIMRTIRQEIAKQQKRSPAGPSEKVNPKPPVSTQPLFQTTVSMEKETRFYLFAKKVAKRLQRLGFNGFVQRVKIIIPARMKYSIPLKLEDFTKYHDEEFLRKAYQGILGRNPDPHGFDYFLSKLRKGQLTKVEVLGRLRYSREGRNRHVKIGGILFPFLFNTSYNIPVAGYVLRLATAVTRLPIILRDILEFEGFTNARFTENNNHFNRFSSHLEDKVSRLSDGLAHKADISILNVIEKQMANKADIPIVDGIQRDLLDKGQTLDGISTLLRTKADLTLVHEMSDRLGTKADLTLVHEMSDLLGTKADLTLVHEMSDRLGTKADLTLVHEMSDRLGTKADLNTISEAVSGLRKETETEFKTLLKEIGIQKLSILDQQRRLQTLLQEAREKLAEGYSPEQIENMIREENHLLDTMYFMFANEFRGPREEVKEKQKIYLRYIEQIDAGKNGAPVLDIGCGRGEWLELLRDNEYTGRGVDHNRTMVQQCKDLGLDVIESEMLKYLRSQEPNTFGMITGFHVVEHLSFEALIALFDESFRTLKSGGAVIFEAPNPENLIVGCCNFYFDPTHRNPIPPKLLDFLLRTRGFSKTEIVKHHPYNLFQDEAERSDDIKRLMAFFNAEQDYAVIGYKE